GERGLVRFVSRGDMSGTHVRELQLWRLAGLNPEGRPWYLKSGQGMAQTLLMSDNLGAYTLTDEGTYLKLKQEGKLSVLTELKRDFKYLVNVYSMYLSKAPSCDNPFVWYVAYKLRDYVLSRGQDLLEEVYKGLVNPVRGSEALVEEAWRSLAELG
ncbi:MAG: substrate-binding domain-containing protein, partial [Desulfurococcaceae archaeon]